MYLKKLLPEDIRGPWNIYGICTDRMVCEVENYLLGIETDKKGISFAAIFNVVNERGPFSLPKTICHLVDENEKIYEFVKGNYRVLFFTDADKLVICCNCFLKQTQKTPLLEANTAKRAKQKYFIDKANKNIMIIREESNGG